MYTQSSNLLLHCITIKDYEQILTYEFLEKPKIKIQTTTNIIWWLIAKLQGYATSIQFFHEFASVA